MFFWLNGPTGTGKLTITQKFAEMVAKNGTLGMSFSCSRDYPDRKELKNILRISLHAGIPHSEA